MSSIDSVELLPWSWKVVCGQNPAYDYFACQHQLFYRNERNPQLLWYDPVFRVTTIYGEEVWRRRHYRVKRGKNPGQFYFTVSDNGVISHEHWRILDCAEDFSWAGAASAAGTSYSGSLLVTPDGKWPRMEEATKKRIESAFDRAHISSWELFEVHNEDCCSDNPAKKPPLDIPFNKTSNHQDSSGQNKSYNNVSSRQRHLIRKGDQLGSAASSKSRSHVCGYLRGN
eukprot:scaffold1829_cov194-Ochromonas_danica.AAC.5